MGGWGSLGRKNFWQTYFEFDLAVPLGAGAELALPELSESKPNAPTPFVVPT
jgi:hypothetical protein